jgi:hypothetical protein
MTLREGLQLEVKSILQEVLARLILAWAFRTGKEAKLPSLDILEKKEPFQEEALAFSLESLEALAFQSRALEEPILEKILVPYQISAY